MNHATLMRVRQSGTNLFQIEKRFVHRQGMIACEGLHVAAGKIFEHQVMESNSGEIDCSAMTKTADDVWMTNAIQRYCFVLKIRNQGVFEFGIRFVLQKNIQRLDDHCLWTTVGRRIVMGHIDLCIAAAPKTLDDVVTTVEPALL